MENVPLLARFAVPRVGVDEQELAWRIDVNGFVFEPEDPDIVGGHIQICLVGDFARRADSELSAEAVRLALKAAQLVYLLAHLHTFLVLRGFIARER
jgi:hypothetical protein